MGRSYLFECPRCSYRAKVSGGADRGFYFLVQTILCHDCKTLHDAVVRVKIPDSRQSKAPFGLKRALSRKPALDGPPTFESVLNRLLPPSDRLVCVQFKIRCPVSPTHKVRAWQAPDVCPKCGTHLEKNTLPYRIWE